MNKITYKRLSPRLWNGNGMGYTPASYRIDHNGITIGRIEPSYTYGWRATFADHSRDISGDKLADVKAEINRRFIG